MRNQLQYPKRAILIAVILALSTMSVFALNHEFAKLNERPQEKSNESPQQKRQMNDVDNIEERVEVLSKELSLSKEQTEQITELFKEHIEEIKALDDSKSNDRTAQRDEMQELKKKFEKKVLTILDKKQQEKFNSLNKQDRPERTRQGDQRK